MQPTTASEIRKGIKTLSLREKIFELHDAVKTLQNKQVRLDKQNLKPKVDMVTEV
jgi:hypothetical protein